MAKGPDEPDARDVPCTTGNEAAIQEMLALVRHFSAIRFTGLPVFVTISGVLADKLLTLTTPQCDAREDVLFAGLLLSFVFAFVELIISRNIRVLWDSIERCTPKNEGWHELGAYRRSKSLLGATRFVLFLPYAGVLSWWASQALSESVIDRCRWLVVGALSIALCMTGMWFTSCPFTRAQGRGSQSGKGA